MLAVPEVDDDINDSSSQEIIASSMEQEITVDSRPLPSTTVDNEEKMNIKTPTSTSPTLCQPHRSRLSQFHRNTIHICERPGNSTNSHQQHHSAPPTHHQATNTGLDAINEHIECSTNNDQTGEPNVIHHRFSRSSTVPYPTYATLRNAPVSTGYFSPYYYYTDYPASFYREVASPDPHYTYFLTRSPLALANNNFQPISPHHHQYGSRPVDLLKPTFLIVPKATEQRLASQLSASNSPVLSISSKTKSTVNRSQSKTESKSVKSNVSSPKPTVRSVEIQTNPDDLVTIKASTPEMTYRHIGLLATPNPSPYIYFGNSSNSRKSPPETSIMQDESTQVNEHNIAPTNIQSISTAPLASASSHQLNSSLAARHYHFSQSPYDEQQQLLTSSQSSSGRPRTETPTQVETSKNMNGQKRPETDEFSIGSLDLAHVDLPGSWRHRSVPIRAVPRRHRAPLPQSFLDCQQYASDSEQIVQSSSYRQQQFFGSIPTIHGPFDSIRSQVPFQLVPSVRLSDAEILKIAAFYRSMGTLVFVAHSLATLYASDFDAMANLKDWKKLYTGVPIWLFNTGVNPKRARCIRLIISELGSSFTLWDTIVNGASDVRLPKPRHITLKSLETGTILALKFDDNQATDEFHQHFVKLSSNPRNADLFDVFNAKRYRPRFPLHKRKIKKSAISKPTKFSHITKVDEHDRDSLFTFSVLVDDAIATN